MCVAIGPLGLLRPNVLSLTRRDILSTHPHRLGYARGKRPLVAARATDAVADVDNVNIRMEVPKP